MLDHGYPLRLVGPNRAELFDTKWIGTIEVLAMKVLRIVLGVVGGLLLAYGAGRLLHGLPLATLLVLGGWLLAALLLHHGVLQPLVLAVGAALRAIPDRARGFVQAASDHGRRGHGDRRSR